jgi:transposase
MLGGGKVKRIYEMHGAGRSIREIARVLDMSRNTVRRYLRSPGVPRPAPRPQRPSKLEPYHEYIRQRVADGVENCVALLRELRAQGYRGGITILKDFVRPLRQPRQPAATVRFETEPGEQAQVDFGSVRYRTPEGGYRRLWVFVMVQSWSRKTYVEFVPQADTATFIRCHVHAF